MSRPRDQQRSKVYEWERAQFPEMEASGCVLTLENCRQLARLYTGRKHLKMKDGRGTRRGYANNKGNWISLPRNARNMVYLLHECAHIRTPDSYPAHGGKFMGEFINLLACHYGCFSDALTNSATDAKLKVISIIRGHDEKFNE